MEREASQGKGLSRGRAALLGLLLWASAFGLVLSVSDAGWRSGLACGVVTGGLGGVVGFSLILPVLGKPINAVVGAMSLGFLGRMLLVAAGLLVTIRTLEGEPMGFALSFFPLFFVFMLLELLVVAHHAQAPASGKPQES